MCVCVCVCVCVPVTHQIQAGGYSLSFIRQSCGNYYVRDASKLVAIHQRNERKEYFHFGTKVTFSHTKKTNTKKKKLKTNFFRFSLSCWKWRLRSGAGNWWRTNLLLVTRPTWNDRKNEIRNFATVKGKKLGISLQYRASLNIDALCLCFYTLMSTRWLFFKIGVIW
jgi:hypothetical protein